MSVNIKEVLNELYALDPDLREKESEIKKIIERMIKNRPFVEINEVFQRELRAKILSEIGTKKKMSWFQFWPFVGIASLCLVVGIWLNMDTRESHTTPLSFAQNIREVKENSFWPIAVANNAVARPQSGGGGGGGWLGGGGDAAISSKMMAPDTMIYPPVDMPVYTYKYTGELKLPTELPVYRKTNLPFSTSDTRSIIQNLSLRDINMNAFRNLGISNLSLAEDVEYGYMLTLDFINGTISMYQNYLRWPQPICDANGCTPLPKLTEADIPSDAAIIWASKSFLDKYNIDISSYGEPKVDSSWKIWYARSADMGQEQTIPDVYTITYPILLDGKAIYEEGGMYRGLTLNYDIRAKRVTGMYGIEKTELQKSSYKLLKDTDLIQQMIKNGSRYISPDMPLDKNRKVVELKLGEPTLEYVHIYGEWKNGKSDEYFVPAYVFPVESAPKEGFVSQTITIPLVEEFVQKINPGPMDPIIYSTKPAIEPAVIKE